MYIHTYARPNSHNIRNNTTNDNDNNDNDNDNDHALLNGSGPDLLPLKLSSIKT